jgi:hypothetical protein
MDLSFSDFKADTGQRGNLAEAHMNVLQFQEDVIVFNFF